MKVIDSYIIAGNTICITDERLGTITIGKTKLKTKDNIYSGVSVPLGIKIEDLPYTFVVAQDIDNLKGQEIEFID